MSYVNYNYELYRQGFRPYGETDPFAASMLNGVGYYPSMPRGQMGPWELHGIGQTHPFTERGGWPLHGLAQAAGVPNGSLVTYQGVWTSVFGTGVPGQLGDPQSIVNGVVQALNADGQLTVMQAPQGITGFLATIGVTGAFDVTLKLQVTNGQGFSSVNDIISIIRHYVYSVTGGVFPQNDRITQVQMPAMPTTSTAPDYQAAGLLTTPGLPSTIPTDFATWLEQNALWLGLGVGALVLLPRLLR